MGYLKSLELIIAHIFFQSVRELNKETAKYCTLELGLGSSGDCHLLREELKKARHKAFDLARLCKAKLVPHLKG